MCPRKNRKKNTCRRVTFNPTKTTTQSPSNRRCTITYHTKQKSAAMCPGKNKKMNACRRIISNPIRTTTQATSLVRDDTSLDQDTEELIKLRFLAEIMLGFVLVLSIHAWLFFILYLLYSAQ